MRDLAEDLEQKLLEKYARKQGNEPGVSRDPPHVTFM